MAISLIITTLLVVALGVAVGSFINAVIFRTYSGDVIWRGRSKCRTCLEPVHWIDLIPVLSFFVLKGRCRKCSSVIEWQYPAVELAMGILAALLYWRIPFGIGVPDFVTAGEHLALFFRDIVIVGFMVVIFVYDLRYQLILDRFSLSAAVLALIFNIALGADVFDMLLGGFLIAGFFALQFLVSNGRWIGGGDIRLGLLMGIFLGWKIGLVALLLSYISGALIGSLLVLHGDKRMESRIPFGTFLTGASVVALIWGEEILNWYLGLF